MLAGEVDGIADRGEQRFYVDAVNFLRGCKPALLTGGDEGVRSPGIDIAWPAMANGALVIDEWLILGDDSLFRESDTIKSFFNRSFIYIVDRR